MFKNAIWITIAVVCLYAASGQAQELKSLEVAAFNLGEQSAVVYYIDKKGTYEVTAIVAPNVAIEGPIVRHIVLLAPGENYTVSIGGQGPGTAMSVIEITREDDTLSVDVWSEKKVYAQYTTK